MRAAFLRLAALAALAIARPAHADPVCDWWHWSTNDVATADYFAQLSEGLVPRSRTPVDAGLAMRVARDLPIDVAGGASAVRQALQARCLNELVLDIAPVLLRNGERIFDDVPEFDAEVVEAATSPLATHVVYKIA